MNWSAKIEKHCIDGLTMDVLYEREGYEPVTVCVLLPPVGADLQEHLARYAPLQVWAMEYERRVARDQPALGTVVHAPLPAAPTPAPVHAPLATIVLEPVR